MSSSKPGQLLSRLRVAIIGGGLSGVATATSLLKLGCSKVTLYERQPSLPSLLSSHSPATVLSANGVRLLDALDVLPSVRPSSHPLYRLTQRNHRGDLLSSFSPTTTLRSRTKDGNPLTSLLTPYPALHSALTSPLPPHIVRLSHDVSAVHRSDSGFTLQLPSTDAHADLIVAADGAHSTTRTYVHTRTNPPPSLGLLVEGVTSTPLPPDQGKDELMEVWGNGQRFGCSSLTPSSLYWYATVHDSYRGDTQSPQAFAQTFSAFPKWVADVIASTPAASFHSRPLIHLPPTPPLHRDAVVLVGSAACVLPLDYHQQTAHCIESALTLALSLRASPTLEEALSRYERLRLPRLMSLHTAALSETQSAVAKSRMMSSLRDMASSMMPKQVSNATYEAALAYNVLKEFPELSDTWEGGPVRGVGGAAAGMGGGRTGAGGLGGQQDRDWDEDDEEDDEQDEIAKRRNSKGT